METIKTDALKEKLEVKMFEPTSPPKQKTSADILKSIVVSMKTEIKAALPRSFNEERFIRIAITAIRMNPRLAEIAIKNKLSFLAALMQSVQMGLEPNTPLGEAYLIPYGSEVQFQIGYQGLVTLAYRTGEYQYIDCQPVYSGDLFEYEYGTDSKLRHVPSDNQEGDPTHYYAVWRLKDGGHRFSVMSRSKVEAHREKYSSAVKGGAKTPWKTDFDAMAMKTVLKKALKLSPKSIELARAFAFDETSKSELSDDMFEVPAIDVEASSI